MGEKNPGTAYTVASRAKTIGTLLPDNPYPQDSNLFFDGTLGGHRFTDGSKKADGKECVLFQKRNLWIKHLDQRIKKTKMKRTIGEIQTMKLFVIDNITNHNIQSKESIEQKIISMLRNPNTQWSSQRKAYLLDE